MNGGEFVLNILMFTCFLLGLATVSLIGYMIYTSEGLLWLIVFISSILFVVIGAFLKTIIDDWIYNRSKK